MGANAQTSVPTFTAGEILTAANMNISARTGIPVFATTVTRDAAFGGTGEKTLAEGQFAYLEDSNTTQYYDGAAWQSVATAPGLTLIKTQTIGTTVSSVEVTGAFSATYDNYRIIVSGGVGSEANYLKMTLGATATDYYSSIVRVQYSPTGDVTPEGFGQNNTTSWLRVGQHSTQSITANIELQNPFIAKNTIFQCQFAGSSSSANAGVGGGYLNNTTSYTAFTLAPNSGTLTGGTIFVYGYKLS